MSSVPVIRNANGYGITLEAGQRVLSQEGRERISALIFATTASLECTIGQSNTPNTASTINGRDVEAR